MQRKIITKVGPIKIYVAESEEWIIKSPKKVEDEFKKIHPRGVCIYGIHGRSNKEKLVRAIKEITDLILAKKGK